MVLPAFLQVFKVLRFERAGKVILVVEGEGGYIRFDARSRGIFEPQMEGRQDACPTTDGRQAGCLPHSRWVYF